MVSKIIGILMALVCLAEIYSASEDNEAHKDYENLLVETLTSHYKKGGRPVKSNKQPVIVYYDLKVTKLEKLLTVNQLLIIHTYVMMLWTDPHLSWNATEFNDTEVITLEPSSIWTPDIMLYNTADDENRGASDIYKAPINVFPNGTAIWYVPVVWKSSCMVDITWFPVDTQTCKMIFASLSYTKSRLQLRYHSLPDHPDETKGNHHVTNGEWDYQGVMISYAESHYGCCNEPVQEIIYEIKIKRKPLFFLLYMIFPVCAVVLLSLLSFVIPADSGERVGFGVTMLLTMGVYLMVISEDLPKTAQRAPLIGVLYVTLFYIMIISYIASTVTISCANKETKPPKFLRMLAKGQAKLSEHHRTNSFRNRKRSAHSIENGCNGNHACRVVDFEGGGSEAKDKLKMTEFPTHKVKDEEKLLMKEIIPDDHDERQKNNDEWRQIAAFLDKAFFWFFLALIFVSAGTIFLALEIMHT